MTAGAHVEDEAVVAIDGGWSHSATWIGRPRRSSTGRSPRPRPAVAPSPCLAAVELDAHLRAHAEPPVDAVVFTSPEGGYLRFDDFRKRFWTPATVDAGLAPLRPHDLRHT